MAKVAHLLEKIVPEHYALNIDVDMATFMFTVEETLTLELVTPNRQLVLHATDMTVSNVTLDKTSAEKVTLDATAQTVTLEFAQEVAAGTHRLHLTAQGQIDESLHGFYLSTYERDGVKKSLATTQFEAIHAREAFVCIDEPSAKAVFEVSLTVPQELTALSNTDPVSTEPAAAGRTLVKFAPTPKMSTYLLAYIVGEFEQVERKTTEGVTVRVMGIPGTSSQMEFALDTAVRCLSFYTEYFDIPYPLSKLDMVALPDFGAGAMENWGLVTYRETALLLDPDKTSLAHKQRVAEVVAHELAHQWFGNLVTMAWWEDLWLNEGFASWIELLAQDRLFPEWQVWTEFVSGDMTYAMGLDGLANTHPIQVAVDDPHSLDEIFDAISYGKGASIIHMLHHYLGAKDFAQGLHIYLDRHKYGNTHTHDLWVALGEASGKPVDEVMSAWTERPGYPIVDATDGTLTQRRFYSSPREAKRAGEEGAGIWPIPFQAIIDGKETEPVLFEEAVPVPEAIHAALWFKPNAGQTGYYRTLYTDDMVDALAVPMRDGALDPQDRFGVVADILATTEAGLTKSTAALKLMASLREEPNYVVWNAISGGLGSFNAIIEDETVRSISDDFGRWLGQPNQRRLGWEPAENETAFDTLMRPLILQQAVRFDDEGVTKEAQKYFADFLAGRTIDPDIRTVALYVAARHGGAAEFDAILDRYRIEASPQVKNSLLTTLARFREPALVQRALDLSISEDVRPQDIYLVIAWGFRGHHSRVATWEFLKKNWRLFIERYGSGGHMLEHFPLFAGSGFATHAMAQDIKTFFAENPHPSVKRPVAQAVESVELKADWYERDAIEIAEFLNTWKKQTDGA